MSYARWGESSDVYVYEDVAGGWACCGCDHFATRSEMVAHLEKHRADGDVVPQTAIDRLRSEIAELGETSPPRNL